MSRRPIGETGADSGDRTIPEVGPRREPRDAVPPSTGGGPGRVRLGIEALLAEGPGSFGRVGLLSNQGAILPDGTPVWQALLAHGFPLVRLFGPEHGFAAQAQDTVTVPDGTFHGIEVVSLYGTRSAPEHDHLSDLDAVIVDIQDVGCRYYTYLYTAAALLDACAEAGTTAIVCDRPNPIGGESVEGGALLAAADSEVGGYGLAQRHGMTIGEFALYLQKRREPKVAPVDLTLFWMEGYRRCLFFEETGLPWKQPSPNLPSTETAVVYPGTCLFEGTNISEGRGTTRPFETVGAPWIEAEPLRDRLARLDLPGVVFSAADFTPTFSAFTGEACRGVQLHVTDRDTFRPLRTGVALLLEIRNLAPERFRWRPLWEDENRSFIDHLAGGAAFREAVDSGAGLEEAYEILTNGRAVFDQARNRVLHYP